MVILYDIIVHTKKVNNVERVSNISKRLKEYRDKFNLTQMDIGQKCGIPYQTLSRYELGQRKPKIDSVCEGSNPSPAAKEKTAEILYLQGFQRFSFFDYIIDKACVEGVLYINFNIHCGRSVGRSFIASTSFAAVPFPPSAL